MNIPNLLTIIRFLLIPVMAVFLFQENLTYAIIVYFIASLTDVIDGFIARKFNQVTNIGKILDPAADKLLQFTALIGLCYIDIIPLWMLIIFFIKELLMLLGCVKLLKKDIIVQAKWFGKASTCAFFLAIVVSMFSFYFNFLEIPKLVLMCIALIMTIFALVMYLVNYLKTIKKV